MKSKIALALDDYDAQLLDKAIRVACRLRGEPPERSHHRFLLGWAIRAVSVAIICDAGITLPLAGELRPETEEETRQRLEKELPNGPEDRHRFLPLNPWN